MKVPGGLLGTIVGIDTSKRAVAAFSASFEGESQVRFVSMDSAHMS